MRFVTRVNQLVIHQRRLVFKRLRTVAARVIKRRLRVHFLVLR